MRTSPTQPEIRTSEWKETVRTFSRALLGVTCTTWRAMDFTSIFSSAQWLALPSIPMAVPPLTVIKFQVRSALRRSMAPLNN